MGGLVHLTAADVRRLPWRNGRGSTDELALGPPGARFERGDFDWRLARAGVAEDGPFSDFAGFDRVLVVTSGAGLRLAHGDRAPAADVRPWQPYEFSGDWPTTATLLAGPVTDLNLLVRRGTLRARVAVLEPGRHELPGPPARGSLLLHVAEGHAQARVEGEPAPRAVGAGESLVADGAAPPLRLELPAGRALVVRLEPWSAAR